MLGLVWERVVALRFGVGIEISGIGRYDGRGRHGDLGFLFGGDGVMGDVRVREHLGFTRLLLRL